VLLTLKVVRVILISKALQKRNLFNPQRQRFGGIHIRVFGILTSQSEIHGSLILKAGLSRKDCSGSQPDPIKSATKLFIAAGFPTGF
jgi:hypothetical protein